MNISGFIMVYLMRGLQKSRGSTQAALKKAQQEWMKFMPKKLLMSLTLTPITDRLLFMILGVDLPKNAKLVEPQVEEEEDIFGTQDSGIWGSDELSGAKQAQLSKKASVESLIILFKCIMLVVIYGYSTYVKSFRETNNNFGDSNAGLTRVIDSMIKKIV